ncbi:hypothetical protein [Duganella sp. CF517]|uniref:hypothetical protein n=1 Tax=Duganella sp. CF517 TaxID=1881038 RepID=UPI0011607471|nr:hypothetical protein [Duganella sp. CF517]
MSEAVWGINGKSWKTQFPAICNHQVASSKPAVGTSKIKHLAQPSPAGLFVLCVAYVADSICYTDKLLGGLLASAQALERMSAV